MITFETFSIFALSGLHLVNLCMSFPMYWKFLNRTDKSINSNHSISICWNMSANAYRVNVYNGLKYCYSRRYISSTSSMLISFMVIDSTGISPLKEIVAGTLRNYLTNNLSLLSSSQNINIILKKVQHRANLKLT